MEKVSDQVGSAIISFHLDLCAKVAMSGTSENQLVSCFLFESSVEFFHFLWIQLIASFEKLLRLEIAEEVVLDL